MRKQKPNKKKRKNNNKKHTIKPNPVKPTVAKDIKKCAEDNGAMLTTAIAALGIYVTFLLLIFSKEGNVINKLLAAESTLGGLYVNSIAVISVAYSKFSGMEFVHKKVYWLTICAFIFCVSIFAQASGYFNNDIIDMFQPVCWSFVLQLCLLFTIYKIAKQPMVDIQVTYKRKK